MKSNEMETWFVRDVPKHPFPVPQKLARTAAQSEELDQQVLNYTDYLKQRAIEDRILAQLDPYIDHVLDPTLALCSHDNGRINEYGRKALYFDNTHLTLTGAMYLENYFAETLFEKLDK